MKLAKFFAVFDKVRNLTKILKVIGATIEFAHGEFKKEFPDVNEIEVKDADVSK